MAEPSQRRLEPMYGNWRRPRSAGLGQLGALGTVVLMTGVIAVVITAAVGGLLPAVAMCVAVLASVSSLLAKDHHGRSGIQRMTARGGWWRARTTGSRLYRSGPLGRARWGTFQLPGLLAQSQLSEARDSFDRPFALLAVPATGHFTIVLATEPEGASLVDQEQVDIWVARWGEWLAALGEEPGLAGVSVTVETAPDTGQRLRRAVAGRVDANSPLIARQVLREVVDSYPVGSATVKAWVSLTYTSTVRGQRRRTDEMARELSTRLPGLTQNLMGTGAGSATPVSAQQLCELVRTAYDPQAGALIEDAYVQGEPPILTWADVGPAAADASWGAYRHDGAISVSWAMSQAPRGEVHSSVLWKLLAPHGSVDRKRVTLLYRVLDPGVAAKVVETDQRNADFRVNSAQRPSQRAIREQRAALATAQEEARGAGLVDFGMLVCATVHGEERLPEAEAAIENLASTARISLRRVYGSQDAAFAAGLPVGLVLARHVNVPESVRSAL